ncbi:MAG: hypothetical protein ABIG89_03305 [Candidatus Woesearchaeota archaeon]
MSDTGIKAVCKKCSKKALATEFILDPVYKMMVCPLCVKERKNKENIARTKAVEEKEKTTKKEIKPHGWDQEDEYLEKIHKQKEKEKIKVEIQRIDREKIRYTCPKCKYTFIYNEIKKQPSRCPYCTSTIFTFKFN